MRKQAVRFLGILALLGAAGIAAASAEEAEAKSARRLSLNWSVGFDGQPEAFSRSSILGFGLVLYDDGKRDVRNHLSFYNGVMLLEDEGVKHYKKALAEKISFGRITRGGLFRPYCFLEARAGTSGSEKYNTFENPLIVSAGLGTGLDIFADDRWCYFIELGFLQNRIEGSFIPQQRFELGLKWMFL